MYVREFEIVLRGRSSLLWYDDARVGVYGRSSKYIVACMQGFSWLKIGKQMKAVLSMFDHWSAAPAAMASTMQTSTHSSELRRTTL